jgi:hypothetical protein
VDKVGIKVSKMAPELIVTIESSIAGRLPFRSAKKAIAMLPTKDPDALTKEK